MKIQPIFAVLLLALSFSLLAQSPEPEQTPDMLDVTETTEVSEPIKNVEMPQTPHSQSPKERALIQSAYDGNLAEVEVLVAKGVSVNLADKKKRTLLILAAYNGHTPVVEFLYGKGADINAKDSDSQTALFYTSRRSFYETAEFLVKNGTEVNARSKKKGNTALMIAAALNDVKMVRLLLDNGADPAIRDNFGATAAVLAGKRGNSAVVNMLSNPPAAE